VLTFLLKCCGWTVAHTPEALWRGVSIVLGDALLILLSRRRYATVSNLHHAFPDRPLQWHRGIARESSRRLIETALLSLASPFFSEERIRRTAALSPELAAFMQARADQPRPVVFAALHAAHWEALVWLALLSPAPIGEFGVIFRPLKQAPVDAYVKRTRERFGLQLLSKRAGFQSALRILRQRGTIGLLFDQSAGDEGSLTLLFDRVCSTSELAGMLAAKFQADLQALYPRRTGFWRVQLHTEAVAHDGTQTGATLALNRWLESVLQREEDFCASWLWAHNRWRTQDRPQRRLRLEQKRDLLAEDLAARRLTALPRRTRFFIRLPNWLGDVVMVLPLLQAVRISRPDAELTLIGRGSFAPLVAAAGVADHYLPLPRRGAGYFRAFLRLRHRYPDTYILFTQSVRGDLEAWLTGCRQRFGLRRGHRRPLLTQVYAPPAGFVEREHHQLVLWQQFLEHFGLQAPLPRQPLLPPLGVRHGIGLIAGSENNPEKRWPVAHWRALIEALPEESFVLFGTANDRPITSAIAAGHSGRVEDLAGKTDLPQYLERLRRCELLVTNDTGGMHLANALGVPLVAVFGPTNPVRTGPVFDAPHLIMQPPGCPPTGGGRLEDLPPARVLEAIQELRRTHPITAG
jgi:heptosyltransferase II